MNDVRKWCQESSICKLYRTAHVGDKWNAFFGKAFSTLHLAFRIQVYKLLMHPILEYSSTVWDPYVDGQTQAVEKVQCT